jgi:cobalt/nickel transport system permease protein
MAVVAPLSGYAVYRLIRSVVRGRRGQLVAAAVGAWSATVAAAIFCAGELAWSGMATWGALFPAMTAVHMVIGVGEAVLTMLVLAAIIAGRQELLPEDDSAGGSTARPAALSYAALLVIALLIFVVPHASSLPDGLERVAATLGFEKRAAVTPVLTAPMGEYRLPWTVSPGLSVVLAAFIGAVVVFLSSFLLARVLLSRERSAGPPDSPERTA